MINGVVGESMTLNVVHETSDEGEPLVVVHCPEFSAVGSGTDIFDALLSIAQEIYDLRGSYVDEPDEKLAPDAIQLKRRLREWFGYNETHAAPPPPKHRPPDFFDCHGLPRYVCECGTVEGLHEFGRHPKCEYFNHHCDSCHERGACTSHEDGDNSSNHKETK